MQRASKIVLSTALLLALGLAAWTLGRSAESRSKPRFASTGARPDPAGYSCFLENTCPPCPGKPIARSQKKEKHGQCSCHQVTYQCDNGSTQTCWDNCE